MRVNRKINAAARQLETVDIRQTRLLANSNRNTAARQLKTADIRQACFLANRIQTAAAREQNTQERQHIRRNADLTYHCIDKAHARTTKRYSLVYGSFFLQFPIRLQK